MNKMTATFHCFFALGKCCPPAAVSQKRMKCVGQMTAPKLLRISKLTVDFRKLEGESTAHLFRLMVQHQMSPPLLIGTENTVLTVWLYVALIYSFIMLMLTGLAAFMILESCAIVLCKRIGKMDGDLSRMLFYWATLVMH